jgi:hypothetical protein
MHYVLLLLRVLIITAIAIMPFRRGGWAISKKLYSIDSKVAVTIAALWGITVALLFRWAFVSGLWGSHHWAILIYSFIFGMYCGTINYGLLAPNPNNPPVDDAMKGAAFGFYVVASIASYFLL